MAWIEDLFDPEQRSWESFYRNRWSHDKVVRSTHGVNCTGGCSWNIHVKSGIVNWEMQALDYPSINPEIPPYEPRGCQRGISYSWYLYSPLRVKYPYVRGALLDIWREEKIRHDGDAVAAWRAIVSDPQKRNRFHRARGKGGFRRWTWEESVELLAAANIHTIMRYGPDRIVGFSPIPAMSMVSYASGARFINLLGGVALSFYDWYCDLPPASPEIWGEQTDVAESADWYESKFIAVVGSNVLMTRTPDAHFLVEARHRGAKVVVFSPDFSQTSKIADEWVPVNRGQDGAFWMAVGHVLLKEYFVERQVDYFTDYLKRYSDLPFLVRLDRIDDDVYTGGRTMRASDLSGFGDRENAEWKLLLLDRKSGKPAVPGGTLGHRWEETAGKWNLDLVDPDTGAEIDPILRLEDASETLPVQFPDFTESLDNRHNVRHVPVIWMETAEGRVPVTTAFELLLSSYGVDRNLPGEWPTDYEESAPYTPTWQEQFTGIDADVVLRFAREWGTTAEKSRGRCMVIIGAGANHWYHNNLLYRAAITPLILCGCVGVNGGGWNHYVGQEKLAPAASWAPIAFAGDWGGPPRLQNTPSFHYVHSSQWRYDAPFNEMCPITNTDHPTARGHTIDSQITAVRHGWLPCFPQFNRPTADVLGEARESGAESRQEVIDYVVGELKSGRLRFSMEDPDNPESFPRLWYIWRGNAILASAKGHEYFLKHYLGTHNNAVAEESAEDHVEEVVWREAAEEGKMDLIVDLNFRMDSSALYSDLVLPAATFYEKDDLNTTDMHSFIHPLQAAVQPCWESKSDWDIFREIARKTSEMAGDYLPDPVEDLVATPLMHDTPDEMAQSSFRDWHKGEVEPKPGITMPRMTLVERDYTRIFEKFVSLGPNFRNKPLGVHGNSYAVTDLYDQYLRHHPVEEWDGGVYPSLRDGRDVCEVILHFAPETNGELSTRMYESLSKKVGRDLTHLASDSRGIRYDFKDIVTQPKRILTTPTWSGVTKDDRTYSAFCQNIEERIPWRTLSGRQHLYLDHEAYRAYGEHLPTFKPRADSRNARDLDFTSEEGGTIKLNVLTPHGKWHIHSTYGDTELMETLSRGIEPVWMNVEDAALLGIEDNEWVEVFNDHGVYATRACVSARIPRGICFVYHSPERTLSTPKSQVRGNRRAGGHNSLTRTRLKPLFMIGGYAQFTWSFNYWGPTGVNRDTYVLVKKLEKLVW